MMHRYWFAWLALAAGTAATGEQISYRVVAQFGTSTPSGLTEGSPGVFYMATASAFGGGSAISVTREGIVTTLSAWPSDYNVGSPVMVSGPNSRVYSSIELSSYPGNVFSVSSKPNSGKFYPAQNVYPLLTQNLPDGTLLGSAVAGLTYTWGIAKTDVNGNVTSIFQFGGTDRALNVIYADDGNYYGVASPQDGSAPYVFRLTPAGSFTTLYSFPAGTYIAVAPLLQGDDGKLYGGVQTGFSTSAGFVYKLTLDGQYTLLHAFPNGDAGPAALIEGSDGNLYGGSAGSLFRITKSGVFTPLKKFSCNCSLTQGSDGVIYGTTYETVFALDAGLPAPKPFAKNFTPQSGTAGTHVRIWGHNLLAAAVQFNGIPAEAVSASGPNYVWATVPAGATSGPITITTPAGSTTTPTGFTVQ